MDDYKSELNGIASALDDIAYLLHKQLHQKEMMECGLCNKYSEY